MELKESLEICIKMWDWLADRPEYNNKKYAIIRLNLLTNMHNECACCEYTRNFRCEVDTCTDTCADTCPLFNLWEGTNVSEGCTDFQSIYESWYSRDSTTESREIFARKIADAARRRLKDFTY